MPCTHRGSGRSPLSLAGEAFFLLKQSSCHVPFLPHCCLWHLAPPASQLRPSFCVLSPCWTQGASFFPKHSTLMSQFHLEDFKLNWGNEGRRKHKKKNKLKPNLHFELHWPHLLLGKFLPSLVDFHYLQMNEYMSSVYLGSLPPLRMFTYLDASGLCCITWDLLLRQAYSVASRGMWDVTSHQRLYQRPLHWKMDS